MKNQLIQRVRRVAVTDPVAIGRNYDYADAFEVCLPEPDRDTPAMWVRAGLENAPVVVQWIASLLDARDASTTSTDEIDGWHVVEASPEVVHLEQSEPLMHAVLVGRKIGSSGRMLTTVLRYKRPVLARLVWAVVGIAHRRTARRVIISASSHAVRSGNGAFEHAS